VTFESHPQMRARLIELLSLSCAGQRSAGALHEILCCLPLVELPDALGYDEVFRVTVVSFLDRFNFCLAGVKRSCIHFVTPGGRIMPFDTYNMLHRPQLGFAWLAGDDRCALCSAAWVSFWSSSAVVSWRSRSGFGPSTKQ
jgi:hypothetical protein